ncbi:MAG: hypothetical protein M3R54_03785, partial [Chloroflexota bacterium]|nr:hypothetical protein [Chloroflexota bacterium]
MKPRFLFAAVVLLASCGSAAPAAAPAASVAATPVTTRTATVAPTAITTTTPGATDAVRYVAIGASDTVGVGATDPTSGSWPARIAALLPPGSAFVNVGVSGSVAIQAKDA